MSKIHKALQKAEKEKTSESSEAVFTEGVDATKTAPISGVHERLVALHKPKSVAAEQFRKLKTTILREFETGRKRCFLITSAVPGEGKTLVSVNLAVSLAQELQKYVLLIEADLRRPSIHTLLDNGGTAGLADYLNGDKNIEDVLCKTDIPHLTYLPAGRRKDNAAELLSSTTMRALLEEVEARYEDRLIIIDATPVIPTSEADILARESDGVILIVRAGKTPREVVKRCIERIGKEKIIGIVLNGVEAETLGYGYGYYKYYGKYYESTNGRDVIK